jgi:hypothetical protein
MPKTNNRFFNPPPLAETFSLNVALPLLVGYLSTFLAERAEYNQQQAFLGAYSLVDVVGALFMKMHRDLTWHDALRQLFMLADVLTNSMLISQLTARLMLNNPSLRAPMFLGPIDPNFPHLRARFVLGHLKINASLQDRLTTLALQHETGVATCWMGPSLPIFFVARNDARLSLVLQSKVGVINAYTQSLNNWFFGGNRVMGHFPLFQPNNSLVYQRRRAFLMKFYHHSATIWLPGLEISTFNFLNDYIKKQGTEPRLLREVVTRLVLYTSSFLLGLHDRKLDEFYSDPDHQYVIDHIAHYCVADRANPVFEKKAYQLFLDLFKANFKSISSNVSYCEGTDANLIRNLFSSKDLPFPDTFEDFLKLDEQTRYDIAMSFCAIALAGMVHSTTTMIDRVVAAALMQPHIMKALVDCIQKSEVEDLTDISIFDKKDGALYKLARFVLYNVFTEPPFPLEFYYNENAFQTTLNNKKITVPGGSFIVANYRSCNQSNVKMQNEEQFSACLSEKSTVLNFVMSSDVASFGGNSKDKKTRKCPGGWVSVIEQLIAAVVMLGDHEITLKTPGAISCDMDPAHFPLNVRKNTGEVFIRKGTFFSNRPARELSKPARELSKPAPAAAACPYF